MDTNPRGGVQSSGKEEESPGQAGPPPSPSPSARLGSLQLEVISGETKKCPMCAEEIAANAAVCPYCDTQFRISVKGYCLTCHDVTDADANGQCRRCGSQVADRHIESSLIVEPAAQPAPPTPAAVQLAPPPVLQPAAAVEHAPPPVPQSAVPLQHALPIRRTSSARTRIVWGILVLALLSAAAGGVLWWQRSHVSLDKYARWPVVLQDSFDTNINWWPTQYWDDAWARADLHIVDGRYLLSATAKQPVAFSEGPFSCPDLSDFYLTADVRQFGGSPVGPDAASIGVRFHAVDDYNFYVFELRINKRFALAIVQDGQWSELVPSAEASAYHLGQFNRIAVVCEGTHIMAFVKDQLIAEAYDSRFPSGKVSFQAWLSQAGEQATFEFDSLELRAPAQGG